MRKLLSLIVGFTLGATIGATLVMLFTPASGTQLTQRLKQSYQEALAASRQAAALRRAQLEAELAAMQQRQT